jgi:phosphatidylglycerophosphate synthase
MNKKKALIRRIYTEGPGEDFIKKKDSWTSIIFSDPFSIPLARFLSKFKRINPNHITIIALIPAFIAMYFFIRGQLVYGAFFFLLNFIIDGVDGKLARLTKKFSKYGEALDYHTDRIRNLALYFSLWYSQYYLQGQWLFGGGIIFAHYVLMIFGFLFISKYTYKTIFPRVYSYYASIDEGFLTFFVAPLIGQVVLLLPILILLQFLSYIILFFIQKEKPDFKTRFRDMLKI